MSVRVLVTGGVRSGKSRVAEQLLLYLGDGPEHPSAATYLACGPQRDDADWAARVAAHRDRRPDAWATVETADAARVLRETPGPVLLDCVGTWLTAQLDGLDAWSAPETAWGPALEQRVDALVAAWSGHDAVVAVTNEVGWGLVSEHRSGRVFADRLGLANQRLAEHADRVLLVVAGQVLTVKG